MNTKDQPAQASGDSDEAVREKIARIVRAHVVEPYASELTDELVAALRHSQPSVQVEGVALSEPHSGVLEALNSVQADLRYRFDAQTVITEKEMAALDKAVMEISTCLAVLHQERDSWRDEHAKLLDDIGEHLRATPHHAAVVEALERAEWAKRRLNDFADRANAGEVHHDAREWKRKIAAAFADFDEACTALSILSKAPQAGGDKNEFVGECYYSKTGFAVWENLPAGSRCTCREAPAPSETTPSSRAEPVAWRPIDTVPRDGKETFLVRFQSGHVAHAYLTTPEPPLVQTFRHAGGSQNGEQLGWPDHWMPVPAIRAADDGSEG